MTFQSTVALDIGFGVPGEWFLDGPTRAQPGIIDSIGTSPPNRVGRVFTQVAGVDGHCTVGGAIGEGAPFFGILMNPKVYPLRGTSGGGTLAPSIDLPQYTEAEFGTMGELIVQFPGAVQIGDFVDYVIADGSLVGRASSNSFTGAISTTTLTVTSFVAGGAPLAVGSVLSTAGATPLIPNTIITALGSGTGGNGTYTISNSQTVSAEVMSASSLPAAGNARVPTAVVTRYNQSVAGLAVIKLTN